MIEFKKILCPTDLSDASVHALTCAAAFARWYAAQLTVLHVVPTFDPIAVGRSALDGGVQMVVPMSRDEVREEMRRVLDSAGIGLLDLTLSAQEGDPARTIVDHALETAADLLVMGTHGRSGF